MDRRNAASKTCLYGIEADRLTVSDEDGTHLVDLPYDRISEVRLAVEMAGQESQIVCRLKTADGQQLAVGSRLWQGPGLWKNQADSFNAWLRALHAALEPHEAQIRYLEGQTLGFMLIMFALGMLLAVMGAGFLVLLVFAQQNPSGLFLIPVALLGGWLARMFWPRAPKTYDPATYRTPPEG